MKRILSALLCAAVCLTGFSGCGTPAKESSRLKLLASFYPIAIMALNITDGVEGVAVESMAQQQTGCLHDFQMTTADMKKAETANAFLINGAGMEGFLDKISDQLPELPVIDSSTGIHPSGKRKAGAERGNRCHRLWLPFSGKIVSLSRLYQ